MEETGGFRKGMTVKCIRGCGLVDRPLCSSWHYEIVAITEDGELVVRDVKNRTLSIGEKYRFESIAKEKDVKKVNSIIISELIEYIPLKELFKILNKDTLADMLIAIKKEKTNEN
jgi:hypothetical protein